MRNDFIVLTEPTGAQIQVNPNLVRVVHILPEGSLIVFSVDHSVQVVETFAQLEALLGGNNERQGSGHSGPSVGGQDVVGQPEHCDAAGRRVGTNALKDA